MPIIQVISPMANTPSISDPANFEANAEAFLVTSMATRATELNAYATQANTTASDINAVALTVNTQAAALTLNSTNDTSATSNIIGTGTKTFTVSTSKSFVAGMWLTIADTAAAAVNSMFAQVTSYSGTTLVVTVPNNGVFGSGTKTAWTISLTAAPNSSSNVTNNEIINGDFRIAQAGTSFAPAVNGSYDLDGWSNSNGSTAAITVAQVTGSTTGRLARQVTITTADAAIVASDYVCDVTRIEGYNIEKYVGKTFTVSFRAKVPVVGIHCVALRNSTGDRSYIKEINFPTANTWQDCSFTVVGGLPTAGTWNYTNTSGLELWFTHMVGTTFQTTADAWNTGNFLGTANQVNDCATVANVWALEKVTLNLGTVAAASETSFSQDLTRAQYYFRRFGASATASGLMAGRQTSTTSTRLFMTFPDMRSMPSVTYAGTLSIDIAGAALTVSASTALATRNSMLVDFTHAAGGTANGGAGLQFPAGVGNFLDLISRL